MPGCTADLIAYLTLEPEVPSSISGPATYFSFLIPDSRRAVVSYWQKYVQEVLINHSGGLSLPKKRVVRLTDSSDLTTVVYCGHKATQPSLMKHSYICEVVFRLLKKHSICY